MKKVGPYGPWSKTSMCSHTPSPKSGRGSRIQVWVCKLKWQIPLPLPPSIAMSSRSSALPDRDQRQGRLSNYPWCYTSHNPILAYDRLTAKSNQLMMASWKNIKRPPSLHRWLVKSTAFWLLAARQPGEVALPDFSISSSQWWNHYQDFKTTKSSGRRGMLFTIPLAVIKTM